MERVTHTGEGSGAKRTARDGTERLARAAAAGHQDSFADLYARVAPALHGWASLRIRPSLRAWFDPDDVVQEVWFRAWRGIGELDLERVAFRPWVFRIAKNVLLEGLRRLREPRAGAGAGPSTRLFALQNLPDSATGIPKRVSKDEDVRRFVECVQAMPEPDRRLVIHVGLEGLSYRETAERLGLEREAVAKRWQRLRARLAGTPAFVGLLA